MWRVDPAWWQGISRGILGQFGPTLEEPAFRNEHLWAVKMQNVAIKSFRGGATRVLES
jgi:hypothetical protein